MKRSNLGSWIAIAVGSLYFLIPLLGTFEFSLRMRRGEYSFDAYRVVLADPNFQALLSSPAVRRPRSVCSSTSEMVPFRPRRRRPLVEPGS